MGALIVLVFFLLVIPCVLGAVGAWLATQRRRSQGIGFAFGFFLGPIGLVIVALLPYGPDGAADFSQSWRSAKFVPVPRQINAQGQSIAPIRPAAMPLQTDARPRAVEPTRTAPMPRQIDAQGRPVSTTPVVPTFTLGENQPRCSSCGQEMPDHWKFQRCPACVLAK
jgi:hypothetical protein